MASVYLSPSTQENNKGIGDFGTEEYKMNQIADFTQAVLVRHGVTVYRNKREWNLTQVVNDSNAKKPDIHFAIHSNAGGGHGCEVFCYKLDGSTGHKIAQSIYNNLSSITPTSDRGIKAGYNYYGVGKHMYEIAYTNAPAVLIETAFHDDIIDASWIMANIERIGTLYAQCLLIWFNIQYVPITPPPQSVKNDRDIAIERLKQVSQWCNMYIPSFDEMVKNNLNVYGLINKLWEGNI